MMSGLTLFLIPVGLLATVAFLTIGLFSMARGGGFSRDQSNKMMRLRVAAQAVTIAVLMAFSLLAVGANT